jgi:type II secretory pathway predicted ATPase ExeA/tetratricopeptide (TPR) repeat protein
MVVTGDVGCGKTTLIRKFMDEISGRYTTGLITNYHTSFGDTLQWILTAFELHPEGNSRTEQDRALYQFLSNEYTHGRRVILIIDEAQNMNEGALEELRVLSNSVVGKRQILQLLLVGQPSLTSKLQRPEVARFAQCITVDCHVFPLVLEDIGGYVQHRLKAVGGDPQIFLPETYPLIHLQSKGVPRLINGLCDSALIVALGLRRKTVDAELLNEVIGHRERGIGQENPDLYLLDHLDSQTGLDSHDEPDSQSEFDEAPSAETPPAKSDFSSASMSYDSQVAEPAVMVGSMDSLAAADRANAPLTVDSRSATAEAFSTHWATIVLVSMVTLTSSIATLHTYLELAALDAEVTGRRKEAQRYVGGLLDVWPDDEELRGGVASLTASQAQAELDERVADWVGGSRRYLSLGHLVEPAGLNAYEMLRRVLVQVPENEEARSLMVELVERLYEEAERLRDEGDWTSARGRLEVLLDMESESERARLMLSELAALEAEETMLLGWMEEAREYEARGRLLGGDGAGALSLYRRVLASRAGDEEALAGVSRLRGRLLKLAGEAELAGRREEARRYVSGLLDVWPDDDELRARLASLTAGQAQAASPDPDEIQRILSGNETEATPVPVDPTLREQELLEILQTPD